MPTTTKPVIILVEDEESDAMLLRIAITKQRGETFDLLVMTDFFKVIQRAKLHPQPALILVDALLRPTKPGEPEQNGRELVEMLDRDDSITSVVHVLTGQKRAPDDLDKNDMEGSVLPAIKAALAPRKNTPDSNARDIGQLQRDLEYERGFTKRRFEAVQDDHADLVTVVEGLAKRGEPMFRMGLVALAMLAIIALLIAYLGSDMDVRSLQTRFKDLQVNVNSETVQTAPMDSRIESDGTDWDVDTLEARPEP